MSDKEQEGKPPRLSAGFAQFLDDSPPKADALQTFDDLDDLLLHSELSDTPSGAVGRALFDELFGARDFYSQLHGLSLRRSEFERKLQGPWPVRDIADFAVTSGHEAVCRFAERISSFARCRKSSIPRLDEELAAARLANNAERIARKEAAVEDAGVDFAKTIQSASKGWLEHRAWIRRSIVNEVATMKSTTRTETTQADDQDIAIHTLEGIRTFLGLGGKYWDNRPDWPDAAAREAMLPDHLRRPLQELSAAAAVASQTRYEHELAKQGTTTGARGERFRAAFEANPENADAVLAEITLELANASKEAVLAETLALANLRKVEAEVSRAQNEVELKLTTDWIARHRPKLEALNARFVEWFDSKRRLLDGLGVDRRQKFAGRIRNSACEVLRDMAHDTLQTITKDSRVPEATFKGMDLGHEEWDALAQAIRNEVAVVESQGHTRSPVQDLSKAEAAPTISITSRLKMFHESIDGVAAGLSNVVSLLDSHQQQDSTKSWGTEIMWIQGHVHDLRNPGTQIMTSASKEWRAVLGDLLPHVDRAMQLWNEDTDGSGPTIQLAFCRATKGPVECGPLNESTYHGLILALALLVLNPDAPGAAPQYAQAAVSGGSTSQPEAMPGVVRLRAMAALRSRDWWRTMELELKREYANAVHEQRPATTPRPNDARTIAEVNVEEITNRIVEKVAEIRRPPRPARQRSNAVIDDIAYNLLCESWDNPDPSQQHCPTQKTLAETVQMQRARDGYTLGVPSVLTSIKQRCPRTREKWKSIQNELARRKQASQETRQLKTLPKPEW